MQLIEKIDLKGSNVELFIKKIPSLTKEQIVQFLTEHSQLEGIHQERKLFKLIVTRTELEFLWELEYHELLTAVWVRFHMELEKGYHIGLGQYIKYPIEIKKLLKILSTEIASKKDFIQSIFNSTELKLFLANCRNKAQQEFEDNQ